MKDLRVFMPKRKKGLERGFRELEGKD